MLDDTADKLYRILFNLYYYHEFNINLQYLTRLSQRSSNQVKQAVNELVRRNLLQWNKESNIYKLIPREKPKLAKKNNYFNDY